MIVRNRRAIFVAGGSESKEEMKGMRRFFGKKKKKDSTISGESQSDHGSNKPPGDKQINKKNSNSSRDESNNGERTTTATVATTGKSKMQSPAIKSSKAKQEVKEIPVATREEGKLPDHERKNEPSAHPRNDPPGNRGSTLRGGKLEATKMEKKVGKSAGADGASPSNVGKNVNEVVVPKSNAEDRHATIARAYDAIPLLEQDKLPRGGISIETKAVGRVQVRFIIYA